MRTPLVAITTAAVLASCGAWAGDATKDDPDKARFISCMDAQVAATNIAEATNGPEVWPLWAQFSREECAQIIAKIFEDSYREHGGK
jgi:hypothetical protein